MKLSKLLIAITIVALTNIESAFGQPIRFASGDETTQAEFSQILKTAGRSNRDLLDLPATVSLKMFAPTVKDQGQYGTCVAWSSAYAARTISFAIRKNFTNADSILKYSFSPGHLYNRIKRQNDMHCKVGSSIYLAMQKLKEEGNLLFNSNISDCETKINMSKEAEQYRIKDFIALTGQFEKITKNEILLAKKSLTEKKPLLLCLKFFTSLFKVGPDGFWEPVQNEVPIGKHALCIVGYDDTKNGGAFEVMNSWGTAWANKGFFWVTYEQLMKYGVYMVEMMDYEASDVNSDRTEQKKAQEKKPVPPSQPRNSTLQLTGSLSFVTLDGNPMPVSRTKINSRSLIVEDDKQAEFSQYKINKNYPGGTAFKVKFTTGSPAYIYIFSQDDKNVISRLFPFNANTSAAINSTNATIYFPSENKHAVISQTPGKENICVLYSKQNLEIDQILKKLDSGSSSLSEILKNQFNIRLLSLNDIRFKDESINFSASADESKIICFFITLEHY